MVARETIRNTKNRIGVGQLRRWNTDYTPRYRGRSIRRLLAVESRLHYRATGALQVSQADESDTTPATTWKVHARGARYVSTIIPRSC